MCVCVWPQRKGDGVVCACVAKAVGGWEGCRWGKGVALQSVSLCLSVDLHLGQSSLTVWPLRARHL